MGKHVIVGAGGVGGGVARELAAAGHEVVVVSRSGRAPAVDGVRAVALDATDADRPDGRHPGRRRRSTTAPTRATTRSGRGSGRRSRRRSCSPRSTRAPVYVIMGNLYGYGPVDGPDHARAPARDAERQRAASACGCGRTRSPRTAPAACGSTEVRASDFVGPESGAQAHLGDRVIPRILAGKKVRAFAAADQPHSWTYVPDVARTIAVLGTDDRSWGRAWHVPTNPALTQREAFASIAAVAGVPTPSVGTIRAAPIRAVGVAVPLIRALGQQLYQFERPFVIDATGDHRHLRHRAHAVGRVRPRHARRLFGRPTRGRSRQPATRARCARPGAFRAWSGTGRPVASEAMTDDIPKHRYDARLANEIEAKWQDRWETEHTFWAPNPTGPADARAPSASPTATAVRARHVPVPERRGPPRRPPARLHRHRRLRALQADDRPQRAARDGLRRVRPAGRAVRGADRAAPACHHRGERREHAPPAARARARSRPAPQRRDHRPRVLPLDAVDLPAALRLLVRRGRRPRPSDRRAHRRSSKPIPSTAGPTLDERGRRELVDSYRLAYLDEAPVNWCPALGTVLANEEVTRRRPQRARQPPRLPPPAEAVDAAHHRVRRPAARRPGPARLDRLHQAHAAQLDRSQRRRGGRLRRRGSRGPSSPSSPRAPTRCSARPTWCSRPSTRWSTRSRRPTGRARRSARTSTTSRRRGRASSAPTSGRRTRCGATASSPRRRASSSARPRARRRPACSPARSRRTRSTTSRSRSSSPTTCSWATAPGRSWPCPRTTSATSSSPRSSTSRS